jgi:hypothetical protein
MPSFVLEIVRAWLEWLTLQVARPEALPANMCAAGKCAIKIKASAVSLMQPLKKRRQC